MPTGMYQRTGTRVERFKLGLPNECSIHGVHDKWNYYEKNSLVTCSKCKSEISSKFQKEDKKINPLKYILKYAKQHAKQKGNLFDITEGDLVNCLLAQDNKCALTGIKMKTFGPYGISLDRIDPSKGYIKNNIQLVCWLINRMKSDLSQDEFITLCGFVAALSMARKGGKRG